MAQTQCLSQDNKGYPAKSAILWEEGGTVKRWLIFLHKKIGTSETCSDVGRGRRTPFLRKSRLVALSCRRHEIHYHSISKSLLTKQKQPIITDWLFLFGRGRRTVRFAVPCISFRHWSDSSSADRSTNSHSFHRPQDAVVLVPLSGSRPSRIKTKKPPCRVAFHFGRGRRTPCLRTSRLVALTVHWTVIHYHSLRVLTKQKKYRVAKATPHFLAGVEGLEPSKTVLEVVSN